MKKVTFCLPLFCFLMLSFNMYAQPGCTNDQAHNYDPNATMNDGSCETCFDLIKNGDEEGVDCGGVNPNCPECPKSYNLDVEGNALISGNLEFGLTGPKDTLIEIAPGGDGFRFSYDGNFGGTNSDFFLFEKLDGNGADPDGGIIFANTGNDDVQYVALAITGDSNVGVGTRSPDAPLEVLENVSNSVVALKLRTADTGGSSGVAITGNNSDSGEPIIWQLGNRGLLDPRIRFVNHRNASLELGVDNDTQFEITSDKQIKIGSPFFTGGATAARVNIKQASPSGRAILFENDGSGNDYYAFEIGADDLNILYDPDGFSTTESFSLISYINEDGAYVDSSDRRLKENIKPLGDNLLEKIMKLEAKTYNFKHIKDKNVRSMGFIAQEVQEVFPELARTNEDNGYLALRYDDFAILSIKGIQEQQIIIETQQKENDELKEKVASLEAELNNLKALVQQALSNNNTTQQKLQNSSTTTLNAPAVLKQNQPNPFNNNTTIQYHLPKGTTTGQLQITDQKGQVIKVINLTGEGAGQVELKSGTLAAGSYFYSLVVDGQVVDTKQMVLTK